MCRQSPLAPRVVLAASADTVNGDVERCADLAHPLIAVASQSLRECSDRDTLCRVEIHRRGSGDRVRRGLEEDFARYPADGGRTRGNDRSSQSWNGDIPGQHHDRSAGNIGQLAPPDLTPCGQGAHDNPAASRNEARSPHSSGSSIG